MIPDFPNEKQELAKVWTQYLNNRIGVLTGTLDLAQSYRHYEGNKWRLTREDKTVDDSNYLQISSIFSVSLDEVPNLTAEKIKEKLDKVADEMAGQMMQNMISKIAQAADSVGNSINANGEPFLPDHFLQVLDRIDHSFTEDGTWIPPTMIVAPDFMNKNKELIETYNNDAEFLAKRDAIIDRKREDWRAREAHRKLVN